jgi:glutamyl endopeptidase
MRVQEQPEARLLQALYRQEKAAEFKRRKSSHGVARPEHRGLHMPVSNHGGMAAMDLAARPEFGKLGTPKRESPEVEVTLGPKAADPAAAATSVGEGMLLDAYWGSFGSASMHALVRSLSSNRSMLEVVIDTDDRVQITNTRDYPWRCICSLLITAPDATNWIGTAWLVSPRLLLTAGHCVYMHNQGGWAQQIEVIPGRHGGERPFQSCVATDFRSVQGWTENRDREYDYAAILLPENCRYGDQLGWFGYTVKGDDELENLMVNLSGYPGDKPPGTQWFHKRTLTDMDTRVLTYDIDTAGGQSGAPVWFKTDDGSRYGVGIHTNGDVAGNSATRIIREVFDNIAQWVAEVP